ncbi:PREDICTED: uncharacterized protein LOC105359052 [Ceratosolen solmsi marchali]|uniref:Uncharacterized protein LOC105359052 n=1 Tax=Ceratosolen solmsi marchali TaxID=326594 RepID=A0AAJ6YAZ9_9HYME|nr:PREDICTED: uncharacterized protein LOC105359052 [Ceratosolen solmsi marchali]
MSSVDSIPEAALNNAIDEVEIKIEYPEVHADQEVKSNYSTVDNANKIQPQTIVPDPAYNLWTSKATSCLINQYKKYRSMVGQTTQFRSLRDMFETISVEMEKHGFFFSPQKCENKWRVLERKYRNLVLREMMKNPGRMKHYGHWEHKRALDEIFSEKRKSVYLQESEYPPVNGSTKQCTEKTTHLSNVELNEDPLAMASIPASKNIELSKEPIVAYLDKFFIEFKNHFDTAEKNKERRHVEKMAIRENELKVQERLLKIKEQKLEIEKKKIIAMAQSVHMIME